MNEPPERAKFCAIPRTSQDDQITLGELTAEYAACSGKQNLQSFCICNMNDMIDPQQFFKNGLQKNRFEQIVGQHAVPFDPDLLKRLFA